MFKQKRHQDTDHNSPDVERHHHKRLILRKKCCRKHCVNRYLCRAANKRNEHNRHLPISFRRQRTACHNRRDTAAETNQHWYKAPAGKPDFTEQLVHDKCHPRHITRILQNRKKEKQYYNNRQKTEHASHSCKHTVNHKTMYDRVDAIGGKPLIHRLRQRINSYSQPIAEPCSDQTKGQIEN